MWAATGSADQPPPSTVIVTTFPEKSSRIGKNFALGALDLPPYQFHQIGRPNPLDASARVAVDVTCWLQCAYSSIGAKLAILQGTRTPHQSNETATNLDCSLCCRIVNGVVSTFFCKGPHRQPRRAERDVQATSLCCLKSASAACPCARRQNHRPRRASGT